MTSGEFEIICEIGHGGMARVYLAYEVALERQVALKVLSPLFSEYPEIIKRFQHEARTAGQLNHPHIVPVFAVYQGDGLSFFTMPFVKGRSFREILHEDGPMEVDDALLYLRQAASGLAYAHQHGVVHRDVKPENMMLEETTGRLVLTDFGLAKALGTESLTVPGDMIGTPHYMAPEQCEAESDIDGRCDQYSLALVAYEMLAGEYPFEVCGFRELLMKQINEHPSPLLERRPEAPEHVCQAVHRALSKAPDDRFPSIEEFARTLLGVEEFERRDTVSRRRAKKGGLFDVKTVWMRDRLVKFHKRRRLQRWTGKAAVTAVAASVLYLAVTAVSRGGPAFQNERPGVASQDPTPVEIVFAEIGVTGSDGDLQFVGPPAPAEENDASEASQEAATRIADAGAAVQSPRSDPRRQGSSSRASRQPEVQVTTPPATQAPATSGDGGRAESDNGTNGGGQESPAENGPAEIGSDPESSPAVASHLGIIELYRQALESEDLDRLREVYGGEPPAKDLEMLERIFNSAEELQVEMEVGELRSEGDRATLDVEFPMRYVLARTKRSQKYTLKIHMTLEHGPTGWRLLAAEQR